MPREIQQSPPSRNFKNRMDIGGRFYFPIEERDIWKSVEKNRTIFAGSLRFRKFVQFFAYLINAFQTTQLRIAGGSFHVNLVILTLVVLEFQATKSFPKKNGLTAKIKKAKAQSPVCQQQAKQTMTVAPCLIFFLMKAMV